MASISIRESKDQDRLFLRKAMEMAALPTYPDLLQLGRISLRERLDEIFEGAFANPHKRIWIAERSDGEPIGMIWLQRSHHPVTELADYLVLNIAVAPEHRGAGVGTQLLETARAFCAEVGVRRLRLFVSAQNEAAYALYRKMGFTEQTREMRLEF